MSPLESYLFQQEPLPNAEPVNISRRRFLLSSAGVTVGALVLGFGLPVGTARAQQATKEMAPGTRVPAFLEIREDNLIRLLSPFVEGGQGVFTAMAQIVGEELDADPKSFLVSNAPAGHDFQVINGKMRITGGSMSVRTSYSTMRKLGALARQMLLTAAAQRFAVPITELSTEPGKVLHAASGRSLTYGELAKNALDLPVPDPSTVTLRDPSTFRWIGKPVKRLDVYEKSTGKAIYAIDCKVEGMLHAAVKHAPRLGLDIGSISNEATVKAMKGVHSVHRLPGAVAVVAQRWWHAKQAVDALQVDWVMPSVKTDASIRAMPDDFSTADFAKALASTSGPGITAEAEGNVSDALAKAATQVEATYHSQYLHHGQLEPPSSLARFNKDGSLDIWLPNQAPEMFQAQIAKVAGLSPQQVNIHSPLLGGFFGRHFLYPSANPYPQAIALAKAVGRPIKLIWSREEEFLRDPLRPMAAVRFRGGLDEKGMPIALEAISACEGPAEGIRNHHDPKALDASALEGLTGKAYHIPNKRIAQQFVKNPTMLAYWRSVGNSMNDFLYECFLDELADKGGQDPYQLRLHLLKGNTRLTNLLNAVVALAGGWKRGPFTAADGSLRARGIAMASPFGSHAAAMAEVSIRNGQVVVHDVWEAIDPGSIVNPAIIEAQVQSASALGLSQVLLEEVVYNNGEPLARNYDLYPILPPSRMPKVHVQIVESGAPMGGIGEPGLPAVPPAVANAVSALIGKRIRSMPLKNHRFES
ncbi:xanthine dehydrogenase family protein molybdopterin-binding subunit [Gallaecimonas mangrovi]|uniref:xanthine dehydrogenase family protein molybdopterin-binding subunit n=1 Tax=Gallaecimonas mangrovi TaxID=2291597 RepID=UPI000E208D2E|nr:xanthine dehydrogenase family protein molybdopterin-binding subunit [Gallaecimonas mangrovi]